jgi:photosystem II stability/assembly factor-like uncharacterized protein
MFKYLVKSIVISASLFSAFSYGSQQPISAMKSDLATQSLLTDITKIGNKLVAVGERGHIIFSMDGSNWQQANVPVNVLLTAVDFKNNSVGFATGHDATLLKTTDGGENWVIVNYQPELDKPFLDINVGKTSGFAVGAYGLFFSTKDGGDVWQPEFQDELLIEDDRIYLEDLKQFDPESYELEKRFLLPHFNSVTRIGDELFLAGERGFFAISSDGGDEWQSIETDYFGSYFSIVGSGNQYYLAGLRGNLFESEDGGLQWEAIKTPAPATINSAYIDRDTAYFFANSGNMFYQKNGQAVMHHIFEDGKAVMSGVVFEDKLILATEAGIKTLPLSDLK